MTACDYPSFSPTRENPSGGCGRPATQGVPLGDQGRHLPVCDEHADRYRAPRPLAELEEP